MNKISRGPLFILISAFFYSTYGVWSRLMASDFDEFSQAWVRGLFLLFIVWILNLKFRFIKPIAKKDMPWFILIALAGGLNQAPYYFGFKYLQIGTATLLFYAALVVGGYLIGKLVFNEKITKVKLLSLVLAIVGMLAVYKLSLRPDQFIAAGFTVLAGLMGACGAVLPKKLSGEYPELQIMSGYLIVMFIANGLISLVIRSALPSLNHSTAWLAQFGYAFALLFANLAVIEGFKHIEASIGSLIGLAEIIIGILFGIFLFQEGFGWGTLIGCILIVFSAALPNLGIKKEAG